MLEGHRVSVDLGVAFLVAATACYPAKPSGEAREAPAIAASSSPSRATVTGTAGIGKPAPDFELRDLEGQTYRLSQFRGKTVVLEWAERPGDDLGHCRKAAKNAKAAKKILF